MILYFTITLKKSFLLSSRTPPKMSSSPNPTICSDHPIQPNNDVAMVTRQPLNPNASFFFPSTHSYYFSPPPPPPFYLFSRCYLSPPPPPPPPSYWMYYPCWFINSNPNRFEHAQEQEPPNPNQELVHPPTRVFSRRNHRRGKKMVWRRMVKPKVESNDDHITTVMLRNIPNRFTREMMIEFMDKHCEEMNNNDKDEEISISAYDFLYLPIDFVTENNKGYAFVNFTNAKAVSMFKEVCNNKPWGCFLSKKVLQITSARIQGKDELVKHFQHMTYPSEAYTPVCFSPARTGSKNTVQITMVGKCNAGSV